jgi:hypothetical protein
VEWDKVANTTTYLVKEKITNTFLAVTDRKLPMVKSHQRLTICSIGVFIIQVFINYIIKRTMQVR